MIFVFGSNLSGIHGAGSAKHAHDALGAIWGVGEGITGYCYAFPTKGYYIADMDLEDVKKSVANFTFVVGKLPNKAFKVTQVGCGLGGFTKEEIAPLFTHLAEEGSNCYFDTAWKQLLPETAKFWGTYP